MMTRLWSGRGLLPNSGRSNDERRMGRSFPARPMLPALLLSALLSTAYGAAFHLWRGGDMRRLILFLLAAWLGFGLGQLAGALIGWGAAMIGEVHVIEATIGSVFTLVVVNRPPA